MVWLVYNTRVLIFNLISFKATSILTSILGDQLTLDIGALAWKLIVLEQIQDTRMSIILPKNHSHCNPRLLNYKDCFGNSSKRDIIFKPLIQI